MKWWIKKWSSKLQCYFVRDEIGMTDLQVADEPVKVNITVRSEKKNGALERLDKFLGKHQNLIVK